MRSQHSEKGAVVVGNRQSGYEKSARFLSAAAIPVTLLVVVLSLQHAPHTTEMSLASRMWLMSGDLPCQGDTQSAWPRNVTDVAGCGRPVVSDEECAPRPFTFGAPAARVRQLFGAAAAPFLELQTSVGQVPRGACAFVRLATSRVGWYTGWAIQAVASCRLHWDPGVKSTPELQCRGTSPRQFMKTILGVSGGQ